MAGPNPNSWKQVHASAQTGLLLLVVPDLVQSNSPSFRKRAFVAAAYATPMACSIAFPRLISLRGCCASTDSYLGKLLSNSSHCTLQRSFALVPRLKSMRAPSRKALHPKSWEGLVGRRPPIPSDNHSGHPAPAAANSLMSKSPTIAISLTASPGGEHFGAGWCRGAETDRGWHRQHFVIGPSADGRGGGAAAAAGAAALPAPAAGGATGCRCCACCAAAPAAGGCSGGGAAAPPRQPALQLCRRRLPAAPLAAPAAPAVRPHWLPGAGALGGGRRRRRG